MNRATFKPIRYDRRQVALMVAVALHFNCNAGEVATRAALVAAGILPPTPKILAFFALRKDGRGYAWNL